MIIAATLFFDLIIFIIPGFSEAQSETYRDLRWNFLRKQLMALSCQLFSQKAPSQIFDRVPSECTCDSYIFPLMFQPIEVENFSCLYGMHERYLNNFLQRFKEGLIHDFYRQGLCYNHLSISLQALAQFHQPA